MRDCLWLQLVVMLAAGTGGTNGQRPSGDRPEAAANSAATVLRVATSPDGAKFTETGEVFARGAGAPALVQLSNGELLAVFAAANNPQNAANNDRPEAAQPGSSKPNRTPEGGQNVRPPKQRDASKQNPRGGMWASRSRDEGKTWLTPRAVEIRGLPEGTRIGGFDLVLMPSGLVRLYVVTAAASASPRDRNAGAMVWSAVTRDGAVYELDRDVYVTLPGLIDARLAAFWGEKQVVLLATEAGGGAVIQLVSRDGRTFSRPERARFAGSIGHVARLDKHHWRMYAASDGEVRARISNEGVRWRDEEETVLRGAIDVAVAAASKDRFIMLFSSQAGADTANAPQLASMDSAGKPAPVGTTGEGAPADTTSTDQSRANTTNDSGSNSTLKTDDSMSLQETWDSFTPTEFSSELSSSDAGTGADAFVPASDAEGFAPLPDLSNRVDYIAWYEQNMSAPVENSAYESYAPAFDGWAQLPAGSVKNMYNSDKDIGPPVPWLPSEHPEWEASFDATFPLVEQFAQGARDPRAWSHPLIFPEGSDPNDRILFSFLLPSLAPCRNMTRETLSNAWRTETGVVAPQQMRDALETCLGNAAHLQNGSTVIERLVASAERVMIDDTARWALQEGVFTNADDIEQTLDILQQRDVPVDNATFWIRGEHAAVLDSIQYLFEAKEPGGEPGLRMDRIERMKTMLGMRGDGEIIQQLQQMTAADAREATQLVDGYFRYLDQLQQSSWPLALPENPDVRAEEINAQNKLAGWALPSLSRAYELNRRAEANRRATRLTFSVEAFRARNGRYPASLDELPPEQISDVRMDPFSGHDFAYKLTDTGATIYSLSRNGKDDGGVHSAVWGDDDKQQESDDFVFWPVQPKKR